MSIKIDILFILIIIGIGIIYIIAPQPHIILKVPYYNNKNKVCYK